MQKEQQSAQPDETPRTNPFDEPRITAEGALEFGVVTKSIEIPAQ